MRSSRLPALLSTGAVLSLAVAVAAPAAASPTPSAVPTQGRSSLAAQYTVARHECAAPRPGQLSCYAMRLVPASKDTAGAQRLAATPSAVPKGPSGFGLTPTDLETAYGYDRLTPVVQTVAIVDAYDDPKAASDLAGFEATYGLTDTGLFRKVGQSGSATRLPAKDRAGWSGEESLDIDAVRAVCASCTILLVEANSGRIRDLSAAAATAVRLGANEVTNSYGGSEKFSRMSKTAAARYAHPGVVVTAATGDDGWYGWGFAVFGKSQSSASQPAALRGVVAVGGTHLSLGSAMHRRKETVWNNFGPHANPYLHGRSGGGATGGGCSRFTKAPLWQRHVAGFAKTGCGNKRLAADISADGDPQTGLDVHDTYYCGRACGPRPMPAWQTIGGTSLSSPLIAAMWALAGGAGGVRNPAATLYSRYATPGHAGVYDVRQGGNAYCDTLSNKECDHLGGSKIAVNQPRNYGRVDCRFTNSGKDKAIRHHTQCVAAKGYDGPSGMGAPSSLTVFTPLPS
jgi:subtilase family serine protease